MAHDMPVTPHILIVESRFYPDITDELVKGAVSVLNKKECTYERIVVPGCLEIPAAIKYAIKSMQLYEGEDRFHGFLALGCVIRGETSHYDYVCGESMRGIQDLTLFHSLSIGNGILTCENKKQAEERADTGKGNKGGFVANACLEMLSLKDRFGLLRQ